MSIGIEEIRLALMSRLGKTVVKDAILADVQLAVEDISKLGRWPDLYTSGNLAFIATSKYIAFPAGFQFFDDAVITGYAPLRIATFEEMRSWQEQQSPQSARPQWCTPRGKKLYAYPISDASYTVVVSYWRVHPDIGDEDTPTILFGDEFTEAVITRTIVQYLKSSKLTKHPKLKENEGFYNREIALLLPQEDDDVIICKPSIYGVTR